MSFVAGTRSHTQAGALRDLWAPLAEALGDLESTGQDVIVDAGRLGLHGSPEPLLDAADLALLVSRHDAARPVGRCGRGPRRSSARHSTGTSRASCSSARASPTAPATSPRPCSLPVIASLPDDPESAAVFSRGAQPPKRFETGPLARALNAAIASIHSTITRRRNELLEGARS